MVTSHHQWTPHTLTPWVTRSHNPSCYQLASHSSQLSPTVTGFQALHSTISQRSRLPLPYTPPGRYYLADTTRHYRFPYYVSHTDHPTDRQPGNGTCQTGLYPGQQPLNTAKGQAFKGWQGPQWPGRHSQCHQWLIELCHQAPGA